MRDADRVRQSAGRVHRLLIEAAMLRYLLLPRIEDTDRHGGLMLGCLGALILLAGVLDRCLP